MGAEAMMGGGMSAIVGAMSDEWNSQRGVRNSKKLMAQQQKYNREMAEANQQRNKEMWDYTNFENQVKHMENAGLNKALMYGGSGGGGATAGGAQGGSAGLGSAPSSNAGALMGMQNMKEMALLDAQKENIQADTENKKAVAEKTSGVDTDLARETAGKTQQEKEFLETTRNDRQLQEQAKAVGEFLQNDVNVQNVKTQRAQIEQKAEELAQGWKNLDQKQQELTIKAFEAEIKAKYPSMDAVAGGQLNNLVETLNKKLGIEDNAKKVETNNKKEK